MLEQAFVFVFEVNLLLLELSFEYLVGLRGHSGVLNAEEVGLLKVIQ